MAKRTKKTPDYRDEKIKKAVLKRQNSELWTPEQIASLAKHFRLKSKMKLLEAGCGYGLCLRNFGPYCLPGGELVGVDASEKSLEMAQDLAQKEGLGRYISFKQGTVEELPFEKNTFDITLAHLVLCRIAKPEKALDELIRVTKRGGCIAVFDNASSGGAESFWCNAYKLNIKQELIKHEVTLRSMRGQAKLCNEDWSVGCKIPGWMENRGLKDIDVRQCERVFWVAPPYKSSAQKSTLEHTKKQYEMLSQDPLKYRTGFDQILKAGGADDKMIKQDRKAWKNHVTKMHKALNDCTLEMAFTGPLWCIWGFKK